MKISIELNNVSKQILNSQTVAIFEVPNNTKISTVVNKVTTKLCKVASLKVTGKFALLKSSAKINILIDGENILNDDIKTLFSLQSKNYGLNFNRNKPENFKNDLVNILEQYQMFINS